jgi:hypothetical protein
VDEELREPVRPARWLAWAVAGLLTAGVVSAGTVSDANDAADQRIVTAAGGRTGGVELPPVVADPGPATTAPAPPPPTTTTAAPEPTTTTVPPTTQAPRTTTTRTPAPATTTPTTPAPAPAGTTLTVVNEHPFAVSVTVNGKSFQVASGQQVGPAAITRSPSGNDVVEVTLVQEPTCGTGDADRYFPAAGSYRMTITASPGLCQPGMPGPTVKVTAE